MKKGERLMPPSTNLTNMAAYVGEKQRVLHTSGKSWCPISYASVVNKGWNYWGQIARIGHFSSVNLKSNCLAFYICFPWICYFSEDCTHQKDWVLHGWGTSGAIHPCTGYWFSCSLENLSQVGGHFNSIKRTQASISVVVKHNVIRDL